jgi:hypothetical protein
MTAIAAEAVILMFMFITGDRNEHDGVGVTEATPSGDRKQMARVRILQSVIIFELCSCVYTF